MQCAVFLIPATLPGMWDRTITIGSAGKAYSVTGWKVRLVPHGKGFFFFIAPELL